MVATIGVGTSWMALVHLLPWLVGLVLAVRHRGEGRWVRLAVAGCALLLLNGFVVLLRKVWVLVHLGNDRELTGTLLLWTWSEPLLTPLVALIGLSLIVAAIFSAGRSAREAHAVASVEPPSTRR